MGNSQSDQLAQKEKIALKAELALKEKIDQEMKLALEKELEDFASRRRKWLSLTPEEKQAIADAAKRADTIEFESRRARKLQREQLYKKTTKARKEAREAAQKNEGLRNLQECKEGWAQRQQRAVKHEMELDRIDLDRMIKQARVNASKGEGPNTCVGQLHISGVVLDNGGGRINSLAVQSS
jgi:hypothetical protein